MLCICVCMCVCVYVCMYVRMYVRLCVCRRYTCKVCTPCVMNLQNFASALDMLIMDATCYM
jgi:hypothetical protein